MNFARFSLSLALLGALGLPTLPAYALGTPDPTTLTGVIAKGTVETFITNVLDPVFNENAYEISIPGLPQDSAGVNYPEYERGGFGFTPTEKNFFYLAGFTYDGTAGQLSAVGGYAMIIHENSVEGGGYYYVNSAQTETVTTKMGRKAYTVEATADAPGSGASNQFAGFSGSDSPILAADRLCVVFYGVIRPGPTDIFDMTIVGPGAHAPKIVEWKHDGSGVAGTHKPTTFAGTNDAFYNFQE